MSESPAGRFARVVDALRDEVRSGQRASAEVDPDSFQPPDEDQIDYARYIGSEFARWEGKDSK